MVDIRTLLRNQDAKLCQQRTQFWKDALAKQDKDFLDKVVKANRDLIWNHVALLHEIKCEISAQLGEDTAAELVPEDCTAGIAEKLLDAIVECVVSGYMDGDGEGEWLRAKMKIWLRSWVELWLGRWMSTTGRWFCQRSRCLRLRGRSFEGGKSVRGAHFEHEQVGQSQTVDPGYELGGRPDRRGRQCPSPHQG